MELHRAINNFFLRITTINFSGSAPRRAGQVFWLAHRQQLPAIPAGINDLRSLAAIRAPAAGSLLDGGDLRALTFPEFVVTARRR